MIGRVPSTEVLACSPGPGKVDGMRIGLVRYLNARPLDHGFRTGAPGTPASVECIEEIPSRLYAMLGAGELDAALISSVECLRNRERFSFCRSVGVCTRTEADSILYLQCKSSYKKGEPAPPLRPVSGVLADVGSRTSVALLQVLYHARNGTLPEITSLSPGEIPDRLDKNHGGLLIGDGALAFLDRPAEDRERFEVYDLARLWYESEGLPFIFALWAYPLSAPVEDSVFEASLQAGETSIDDIVAAASYPDARRYLTQILHYRVSEGDLRGLARFQERLDTCGLL